MKRSQERGQRKLATAGEMSPSQRHHAAGLRRTWYDMAARGDVGIDHGDEVSLELGDEVSARESSQARRSDG